MDDRGSYGAQVATISTIVARLLSAASAAERKVWVCFGEKQKCDAAYGGGRYNIVFHGLRGWSWFWIQHRYVTVVETELRA